MERWRDKCCNAAGSMGNGHIDGGPSTQTDRNPENSKIPMDCFPIYHKFHPPHLSPTRSQPISISGFYARRSTVVLLSDGEWAQLTPPQPSRHSLFILQCLAYVLCSSSKSISSPPRTWPPSDDPCALTRSLGSIPIANSPPASTPPATTVPPGTTSSSSGSTTNSSGPTPPPS